MLYHSNQELEDCLLVIIIIHGRSLPFPFHFDISNQEEPKVFSLAYLFEKLFKKLNEKRTKEFDS